MAASTRLDMRITLGYGCDQAESDALNQVCASPLHHLSRASRISNLTASWFGSSSPSSSSFKVKRYFVASAADVALKVLDQQQGQKISANTTASSLLAVFVPPSFVDNCLERYASFSSSKSHASGSCFWIPASQAGETIQATSAEKGEQQHHTFADALLLPTLHPKLANVCQLLGIVRTSIAAEENAPAELVLLELPAKSGVSLLDLLKTINCEGIHAQPEHVLKIVPLASIHFTASSEAGRDLKQSTITRIASSSIPPQIPACPVCLHRIDPVRLGLPTPTNSQLCSKFCPPPPHLGWSYCNSDGINISGLGNPSGSVDSGCPKQRFLQPWAGSRCRACQVIAQYWRHPSATATPLSSSSSLRDPLVPPFTSTSGSTGTCYKGDEDFADLFCGQCAMHKTLWVCLTCGFVGCGRYSNKHSVAHFQETHHPYSLELATLRIWDYVHEGGFAHRVDLLECPSSPPLAHPWMMSGRGSSRNNLGGYGTTSPLTSLNFDAAGTADMARMEASRSITNDHDYQSYPEPWATPEKSPKKATMIGEEYEALLQSALEDQALHYEGEISRIRAELTVALVDETALTSEEQGEIQGLRQEIESLRRDVDVVSRELLEAQAEEAKYRAASQRLLHEQQEANSSLRTIQDDAREEAAQGRLQVEEMEQQIRDLTANLRMRQAFSQNEELNEAQIFGTTGANDAGNNTGSKYRRGKKKGRARK